MASARAKQLTDGVRKLIGDLETEFDKVDGAAETAIRAGSKDAQDKRTEFEGNFNQVFAVIRRRLDDFKQEADKLITELKKQARNSPTGQA